MDQINGTTLFFFILKGFSDVPKLQLPIFLLVLLLYLIILGGNLIILLLLWLDPQLHTPMYFFLGNLSFIDMSSTTINLHKFFTSFLSGDYTISFSCCMTQLYMFSSLTTEELLILTAMSYDRYVAICNPLNYHSVMNNQVCVLLATICYIFSFIANMPFVVLLSMSSCYASNIINHFFCDLIPLMKLSCANKHILELYTLIVGSIIGYAAGILTTVPYIFIIKNILNIRSSTGKRKAFYTCSSHLTVVVLLYITLNCQYLRPSSMDSLDATKLFSLVNTIAVPILNPLIYSLKNKEVKMAFRRRIMGLQDTS